ncbi:Cilia- and flagella-associated protein 57, variant 2 [Chamberlinius hualienensis]
MSFPVALITPNHIFGLNSDVIDNLAFISEQHLIFISGLVAVVYDIDHHTQRLIHRIGQSGQSSYVHLMTVSFNKQLMAIGERCDNSNRLFIGIHIFDVTTAKKLNTLSALKLQKQLQQQNLKNLDKSKRIKFVSIAFSYDSKCVIGQTGPPDWLLIYWEVANEKPLLTLSLASEFSISAVRQVTFHPHDNNQISVVGAAGLQLFQWDEEKNFKLINAHRNQNATATYYCHCWVSDNRILVGCDKGVVILIEGNEINQTFQIKIPTGNSDKFTEESFDLEMDSEAGFKLESNAVVKLSSYSKGFICTCGLDSVYLFERYAGGKVYRQAAIIKLPPESPKMSNLEFHHICAFSLSPSEDVIAVATAKRVIYTFTTTSVDINKHLGIHFEQLTPYIHCNSVVDIDICLQKPIAVSCSIDGAVAVWNYVTNQQQLYQYLNEEVHSIALHPTGHYIAVGCKTSLRLMGLMIDELRTVHEFSVKECPSLSFSHSGHLIAAIQGSIVVIFSTITFDTVASFKGHVGKITAIAWSNNDLRVISCGVDGAVYEWDVYSHKRLNEVLVQHSFCNSIATSKDNFTIFVAGCDCVIREMAESQVLAEVDLGASSTLTSVVTLECGKGIIVSSSKGHIWFLAIPLASQEDNWHDVSPISADINKLKVTKDDKWLLSVSSDGIVCIWSISDQDGQPFQTEEELPFLEEILITRADLEEKNVTIYELDQQLKQIKLETIKNKQSAEEQLRLEMENLTNNYEIKIEDLRNSIKIANEKNVKLQQTHKQVVDEMTENMNQTLKRTKQENDQKLLFEYLKTDELHLANENLTAEFDQKVKKLEQQMEIEVQTIQSNYKQNLNNTIAELNEIKTGANDVRKRCTENIAELKSEADLLIVNLRQFYESQIIEEKQNVMKIKSESAVFRRKIQNMEREIGDHKRLNELGNQDNRQLQLAIQQLQREVSFYKMEINNRDKLLQSKELALCVSQKENKNLEQLTKLLRLKSSELNKQLLSTQNLLDDVNRDLNLVLNYFIKLFAFCSSDHLFDIISIIVENSG